MINLTGTRFQAKFTILISVLSLVAGMQAVRADGLSVTVRQINQKIAAERANWKAGENSLTQLPKEQIQRMLGVADAPHPDGEFAATVSSANRRFISGLAAPTAIDWRSKDGANWVSPILNQGNCGSCVAFASAATLETQVNITSGIPGLNPSFSTQALFVCGGGACEFGWMPALAAKYLVKKGVPDEACAPYTMGATGETVACNTACKDADQRSTKIVKYTQPTNGTKDIESVKAALKSGPLMTAMMVYEDFVSYSGGIYKHVTGTTLGGHAISIVGYDDATRSWVIRNSWGKEWGENGFARVSWDDASGIGNQTFGFQVPTPKGYLTVKNPHGRDFLAGTYDFEAESTFADTAKVDLVFVKTSAQGAETKVRTSTCTEARCVVNVNTETLANDYYQIYAVATLKDGTVINSQREQFFVFNGKPEMKLEVKPTEGADFSKPIKGRIVFQVTSSTGGNVPFSELVFHVADGTKEVLTRSTALVLPDMTFGWRTNASSNGRYKIWFEGILTTPKGEFKVETAKTDVTISN